MVGLGLLLAAGNCQAQNYNFALPAPDGATPAPKHDFLTFDKQPKPVTKDFQKAAFFQGAGSGPQDQDQGYELEVDPPGPTKIFQHLDSEAQLQERLRQKGLDRKRQIEEFPDEPVISKDVYAGRAWPVSQRQVEPNYVTYDRLFFEDKNTERYGWELGLLQPAVSALTFYKDLALMPYHYFSDPCRVHETSAGYCLPGDPVPYLLYPPGTSASGAVGEAAFILGLIACFP